MSKPLDEQIDEQISRRWKPTAEEMAVLGEMFVRCPMPTVSMIAELGLRFGLPPRQVRVWFQNRRQRTRNSVRGKHNSSFVRPASAGYRRIMSTSPAVDAGSDWSGSFGNAQAHPDDIVLNVDSTIPANNERTSGQLAVDFVDEFIGSADEMACAAAWDISSALVFESSRGLTYWLT